ncbi:LysR family transcriptional regulator, partial [Mesorhizobium sp. M7A.F.Ca.US.014.04.1.1]
VSIDPWFARMVLAPRIGEFLARYTALSLDLTTSNYREEMMSGADVAVRFGPPDESSLIARKLLDVPVLTCAAPSYLDRHGIPATPHDLMLHDCILFRNPQTGRPFTWEFRGESGAIEIKASGRLVMDDPSAAVAAGLAGQGIFQSLAIGLDEWLESGALTTILAEWSDEQFPLYAYHPSRHMPPAKVRAFLDFVQRIAAKR